MLPRERDENYIMSTKLSDYTIFIAYVSWYHTLHMNNNYCASFNLSNQNEFYEIKSIKQNIFYELI